MRVQNSSKALYRIHQSECLAIKIYEYLLFINFDINYLSQLGV